MIRYKLLLMLCFYKSFSQDPNNLSYEKNYFNGDKVSMAEDKFHVQYGFGKKMTVFSNYNHSQISTNLNNFTDDKIKSLHNLNIGIMKEMDLQKGWNMKMTFNPQLITNDFKTEGLRNFVWSTGISFHKDFKNDSGIDFGAEYGVLFGKPSIYPVFKFNKTINVRASYTIGFPESNFKFNINNKNSFSLKANYNSYYSRINGVASVMINEEIKKYDAFYLSGIKTALEYNYIFFDGCIMNITVGKSFDNTMKLKENNNNVSGYDFKNTGILSMGFKYNLNFK